MNPAKSKRGKMMIIIDRIVLRRTIRHCNIMQAKNADDTLNG